MLRNRRYSKIKEISSTLKNTRRFWYSRSYASEDVRNILFQTDAGFCFFVHNSYLKTF